MTICIFGDSITWGASDYEKGGWVERLKAYFLQQSDDVSVYNLGISGDTTEGVLERFEGEAKNRQADVIVFAIGINDSQYVKSNGELGVTFETFEKNISRLADMAKKLNGKVVCVGLTKVDERKARSVYSDACYDNKSIKNYDAVIKSVCERENMDFIEMFDLLELSDLDDGVHPNAEGHRKMFEKVKAAIVKKVGLV